MPAIYLTSTHQFHPTTEYWAPTVLCFILLTPYCHFNVLYIVGHTFYVQKAEKNELPHMWPMFQLAGFVNPIITRLNSVLILLALSSV